MKLIVAIALGYVFGQILLEILGIVVDRAARFTGRGIALLKVMLTWQREVVAQRKADEDARRVVKGHVEVTSSL
jgi:hypothetical protein